MFWFRNLNNIRRVLRKIAECAELFVSVVSADFLSGFCGCRVKARVILKWQSVVFLFILITGFFHYLEAVEWTFERLTFNTVNEGEVTIAADSEGKAHIAYTTQVPGGIGLYYITNQSGSWFGTFIDSMVPSLTVPWVATDQTDRAHISYVKGNEVWYASNLLGPWTLQQVTSDQGNMPRLAVDGDNRAHILYRNTPGDVCNLWYTHNVSGVWNFYQVTDDTVHLPTIFHPGNIAVDNDQNAHIVYHYYYLADSNYHVIYANNVSGDWDTSWVTGDATRDLHPILYLDENGHTHLTYTHGTPGDYDIYYAHNISGTWSAENINALYNHQRSYPFYLDDNGKAHIVYRSRVSGGDPYRLYYATNITGVWTNELIEIDSMNISNMWFALNNEGYGHIAYCMTDTTGTWDYELWYGKSNTSLAVIENESSDAITEGTNLFQNTPNPFKQMTDIRYQISEPTYVSIKVYNIAGQMVRTLVSGTQESGTHSVVWRGESDTGKRLANGIYFCQLESEGFKAVKKLLLVR